MNTDERGYFDDAMTERVPGAIFEVSNTLGAIHHALLIRGLLLWIGAHPHRVLGDCALGFTQFQIEIAGHEIGAGELAGLRRHPLHHPGHSRPAVHPVIMRGEYGQ
ncbi:MAG: hypothetical protein FJW37_03195 [Acidobacteria bacterium]|nr:hypothetical protein [Acidobacteriota bacterium]